VLETLARVLSLDEDQRAYPYELAGRPARPRASSSQKVRPQLESPLARAQASHVTIAPMRAEVAFLRDAKSTPAANEV